MKGMRFGIMEVPFFILMCWLYLGIYQNRKQMLFLISQNIKQGGQTLNTNNKQGDKQKRSNMPRVNNKQKQNYRLGGTNNRGI